MDVRLKNNFYVKNGSLCWKLSFALSEATISEDDAYNFGNSQKKSVSFNEKVQQQYYR